MTCHASIQRPSPWQPRPLVTTAPPTSLPNCISFLQLEVPPGVSFEAAAAFVSARVHLTVQELTRDLSSRNTSGRSGRGNGSGDSSGGGGSSSSDEATAGQRRGGSDGGVAGEPVGDASNGGGGSSARGSFKRGGGSSSRSENPTPAADARPAVADAASAALIAASAGTGAVPSIPDPIYIPSPVELNAMSRSFSSSPADAAAVAVPAADTAPASDPGTARCAGSAGLSELPPAPAPATAAATAAAAASSAAEAAAEAAAATGQPLPRFASYATQVQCVPGCIEIILQLQVRRQQRQASQREGIAR